MTHQLEMLELQAPEDYPCRTYLVQECTECGMRFDSESEADEAPTCESYEGPDQNLPTQRLDNTAWKFSKSISILTTEQPWGGIMSWILNLENENLMEIFGVYPGLEVPAKNGTVLSDSLYKTKTHEFFDTIESNAINYRKHLRAIEAIEQDINTKYNENHE